VSAVPRTLEFRDPARGTALRHLSMTRRTCASQASGGDGALDSQIAIAALTSAATTAERERCE
jgi:hypothetical protein